MHALIVNFLILRGASAGVERAVAAPFGVGALGGVGSAAFAATLFLVLSPILTTPLLDDLSAPTCAR